MKKINKIAHTVCKIHLKTDYPQSLVQTKLPNFVQERINYFAEYVSKGLTYTDLYLLIVAEPNEEELQSMFESFFDSIYIESSYQFSQWYRDPHYWKQRQVELASEIIRVYQKKIAKERMIV